MRKFMIIAIPIVTIALFILIMLSGDFLKKPIGKDDDIPNTIKKIEDHLHNENWEQVSKETKELKDIWNKIVRRVQISSERDEIKAFNMNMARLRGAIMAKDKSSALMELNEAYEHWKELGN